MSLGLNYKIIKQTECAKVYRLLQVVLHVSIIITRSLYGEYVSIVCKSVSYIQTKLHGRVQK